MNEYSLAKVQLYIFIDFQLQRYKDYFIFTITLLQNATKW